jgi:ribosomal protein L29
VGPWMFWDEAALATRTWEDLEAHLRELRRAGARRELLRLARRFVERGKGADTVRLFTPEEIRSALNEIERSSRSRQFVDPVRLRMYRRYLAQVERRA